MRIHTGAAPSSVLHLSDVNKTQDRLVAGMANCLSENSHKTQGKDTPACFMSSETSISKNRVR